MTSKGPVSRVEGREATILKPALPQPKYQGKSNLNIKLVLTFQKGSLLRLGWEHIAHQRYSMYFRTGKTLKFVPQNGHAWTCTHIQQDL